MEKKLDLVIYIGRFERNGNDCKLHNAYNIRTWGTTKGLCELVNGATSSTKLDKSRLLFAYLHIREIRFILQISDRL